MSIESNILPLLAEPGDTDSSAKPTSPRKPPGRRTRPAKGDKRHGRTKVANGTEFLPGVDGRSLMARRYHEITRAIQIDQGFGDDIPEARLQFVRRFSAACALAESLEAKFAKGEEISITEHALLCSTMVRVANKIGIDRVARDVTTLGDYLRQHIDAEPAE